MGFTWTIRQREMLPGAIAGLAVIALTIAGYRLAGLAVAWLAIVVAAQYSPTPTVTTLVPEDRDRGNRSLIAGVFFWVQRTRRQELLDAGSPARRAAFVAWQRKLILLLAVVTVAVIGISEQLHPAKPLDSQLAVRPSESSVGRVKSIELHETAVSTAATVTTDTGIFQVRGAVSAAVGDTVTLKVTPVTERIASREICVNSSIKPACYPLR